MTDERDVLELLDALRGHLVAYPGDQQAREDIRRLARETDSAAQSRPVTLETWDKPGPPPPRRWLVKDWLPAGRVTLLAGQGGIGKSRLALQLAAGIAIGVTCPNSCTTNHETLIALGAEEVRMASGAGGR